MKIRYLFFSILLLPLLANAQPVPNIEENIPYLMTFGPQAATSWGDDDYSQTFFFLFPKEYDKPVFVWVFDPDVGGKVDEQAGAWNTRVTYSIYGGKGCWSDEDAQGTEPTGNYKSGSLLASKSFGEDSRYDNNWYVFGPFNPTEGEFVEKYEGNVLKIISEGVSGDDGNMYRYFISNSPTSRVSIEGANAFAYEYSFRMHDEVKQVSHIYPYVDDQTVSVRLSNFDWDSDGYIKTVSIVRQGQLSRVSTEDTWIDTEFRILEEEKNTSLDLQFIKKDDPPTIRNNNVVIYVKNQYGRNLEFFTSPIGGVPKYKYAIGFRKKE